MTKIVRTNIPDEVVAWLMDAIKSGTYKQGQKLPSVEQLADQLGVGRSSIREAWQHLQALGIIQITHGKGTYVSNPRLPLDSQIIGFSSSIHERGMKPGSIVLEHKVIPATQVIANALKLAVGDQVNMLHRLRLADDIPMAIQISYTPTSLFPDLLEGPWFLDTSLYAILAEKYSINIAFARQTLCVNLINKEHGKLLHVKAGSAALVMDTIAYTTDGTPVEYGHDVYRGDRYQYTVTLQK